MGVRMEGEQGAVTGFARRKNRMRLEAVNIFMSLVFIEILNLCKMFNSTRRVWELLHTVQ